MSTPAPSAWPDPSGLPFSIFGGGAPAPATGPAGAAAGLAAGVDWMKSFFGNLPGGSALPGFLVPTVDVDELDKRISDLRAAESWLEVNLNLLRATIQGLEVQRHTIAAVQSWSAMADPARRAAAPSTSPGGLPPGWPTPPDAPARRTAAPPVEAPPPVPEPAAPPAAPRAEASPDPAADRPADAAPTAPASPLAALAANNWLGFMQDQFNRVAQAALKTGDARASAAASNPAAKPASRPAAKSTRKAAAKKATPRRRTPG